MPDLGEIFEVVKTQYATWGYLLVFLAAYVENTILLGIIFPGSSLLLLGAIFAAQGVMSLPLVILFGWAGMFLGCCTDYWVGRGGLWKVIEKTRLRKWLEPGLKEATVLLHTKGGRAIFLSHTLGQIRTFVAVTAGIVKMPFRKFGLYELGTTLTWSLIYCSVGYFVGGSLESITDFFRLFGMGASVVLVVFYLIWKKNRAKKLQAELALARAETNIPVNSDKAA